MRVALVSEHASPLAVLGGVDAGGQNVHVAALACGLAELGSEVTVYTRREDPDVPTRVPLAPGVMVEHVKAGPPCVLPKDDLFGYMDEFAQRLRRAWSLRPPDVVHAHFWMSGYAALAAARPLQLPTVQTFHALGVVKRRHQGGKDTSPPERAEVEQGLVENVDHIVATCSDEVFELARLGASLHQISVVPCGVDLDHFSPVGPVDPRPEGRGRVVVVSRLVERKGIGNVVEAVATLPEVELVVAGGPPRRHLQQDPEARRLAAMARDLGMEDRLVLRGRVERPDLPALLRSADVVACVPWYEPFGIVPLEAMACGVPVVASAVGGLVDTVVDGVTGIHVPPRRPDRVAKALAKLLDDPSLARAYGKAGAHRAQGRYSWDKVAANTLSCYRQLLTDARSGSTAGQR